MSPRLILLLWVILSACGQNVEKDQGQLDSAAPSMALTGRVVDDADLLTDETEKELTSILANLEQTSGPQFVIATTKSLNGLKITDCSLKLARAWGIGNKHRDDGVLLLVAPNEREVRIEVGYGLEASLSDPFCAEVIREAMLPAFSAGQMEEGILNGAARLIKKMQRVPSLPANDNAPEIPAQNRKIS
ncbi:MAG: TPM domain-containing protein [Parasphingorhabdus sp.]